MGIKIGAYVEKNRVGKSTNTRDQKVSIQVAQSVFIKIKSYSVTPNIL